MKVFFRAPAGWSSTASSFFFQAEDGIRDWSVTGVQTCALPISWRYCGHALSPEGTVASACRLEAASVSDFSSCRYRGVEAHAEVRTSDDNSAAGSSRDPEWPWRLLFVWPRTEDFGSIKRLSLSF